MTDKIGESVEPPQPAEPTFFRWFPELQKRLPWVALTRVPTQVHRLADLGRSLGVEPCMSNATTSVGSTTAATSPGSWSSCWATPWPVGPKRSSPLGPSAAIMRWPRRSMGVNWDSESC